MTTLTDKNYVDIAKNVIIGVLKDNYGRYLTISKIRNLLALTSNIFDESKVKTFDEISEKLAYLRVQFVYQAGRENSIKTFVTEANILKYLNEVDDNKSVQRFCRYMEALVAYFKFYGGRD